MSSLTNRLFDMGVISVGTRVNVDGKNTRISEIVDIDRDKPRMSKFRVDGLYFWVWGGEITLGHVKQEQPRIKLKWER